MPRGTTSTVKRENHGTFIFIIIFLAGRDFASNKKDWAGTRAPSIERTAFRALSGTFNSVAWFPVPLRALYVPLRRSLRALYHVPL